MNSMGQQESPTQCTWGRVDKSMSLRVGDLAQKVIPDLIIPEGPSGLHLIDP